MSFACRIYVLAEDGKLSRISGGLFSEMLRAPDEHPFIAVANQRLRTAEILVELANRKPHRVVKGYFFYMAFDRHGVLDARALLREAAANIDGMLGDDRRVEDRIVGAQMRFAARGRRWKAPLHASTELYEAALGMRRVPYLRTQCKHE
jgi:hypothetical protein